MSYGQVIDRETRNKFLALFKCERLKALGAKYMDMVDTSETEEEVAKKMGATFTSDEMIEMMPYVLFGMFTIMTEECEITDDVGGDTKVDDKKKNNVKQ